MSKRSNGRGGRKSWQQLSREVDKAAGLTPVKGAARKAPKAHASTRPRKSRAKDKPPADPMDREVPTKLGKEAIKIRENELAEKVLLRERLQAELRESNKAKRGEIETLAARIHELAQVCTDDRTDVIHAVDLIPHAYIPTQEDGDPCGVCDTAGFVAGASAPIHYPTPEKQAEAEARA